MEETMHVLSFVWPWPANDTMVACLPLVVGEIDRAPFNAFALVLFLLQLENVLNKELLQRLVRVVNTQLLEWIRLEALEAKYVQQANCISQCRVALAFLLAVLAARNSRVDFVDNPRKETPVDPLKKWVIVRTLIERCELSKSLRARWYRE